MYSYLLEGDQYLGKRHVRKLTSSSVFERIAKIGSDTPSQWADSAPPTKHMARDIFWCLQQKLLGIKIGMQNGLQKAWLDELIAYKVILQINCDCKWLAIDHRPEIP